MVDFPQGRKRHIARLFGRNREGERLGDLWLDMVRLDEAIIHTQDAIHPFQLTNSFQKVTIRLKWGDDAGVDGSDDASSRITEIIKLCAPDEDPEDPEEYIPCRVIRSVRLSKTETISTRRFLKLFDARNRKEVDSRRFFHYDTNIDSDADSAFEGGSDVYVVSTDDYQHDLSTKDEDQYIEHEVAKRYGAQATHHWLETSGDDLTTTLLLKNQYLIDISDPATFENSGENGRNPPWRLDPFQNIINFASGIPAVEFFP